MLTNKLKILSASEIDELYALPLLGEQEQWEAFELNEIEQEALVSFHTQASKLLFILQLGYFKIKQQFWAIDSLFGQEDDLKYLLARYFSGDSLSLARINISKPTRLSHQKKILELFRYRRYTHHLSPLLSDTLHHSVRVNARSGFLFQKLLDFVKKERIVLPAYSHLQNMIGEAIQKEQNRLIFRTESLLDAQQKEELEGLLIERPDFIHSLTLLKRDPKSFSYQEMKKLAEQRRQLESVTLLKFPLHSVYHISRQNLQYYASKVHYYSIYRLQQMSRPYCRFLLSCFLYVRYYQLNDHLVQAFLFRVKGYRQEAKANAKERFWQSKKQSTKDLRKAGRLLQLFLNEQELPDEMSFREVREKAFEIADKQEVVELTQHLEQQREEQEKEMEWEEIDRLARRIRTNLRPLFLLIPLVGNENQGDFLSIIRQVKSRFESKKKLPRNLSMHWIAKTNRPYIRNEEGYEPFRYEFQLYQAIEQRLGSGTLFVPKSMAYNSLEDDLLSHEDWKGKQTILLQLGLERLQTPPNELLEEIKEELDPAFLRVNERIIDGSNAHVKRTGKRKKGWKLPYQKPQQDHESILDRLPAVGLHTVLSVANAHCGYEESFVHLLDKDLKKPLDISALLAVLTATGTNMGLTKMARNSNIPFSKLQRTYKNHFRPETLKRACDQLIDKVQQQPIFKHWNVQEQTIYSSSDGQKFESRKDTYNARHSSKYFGLGKGIVSYTLTANHLPLNARIIGANEYEGHYVLDLLLNNTSEVKPEIHTTDTHGTNRLNFALLYLFGYSFAPRYRNIQKVAERLYSFESVDLPEEALFQPVGKVNSELIVEEWDNILRICASLAKQTTSQHILVRKLHAYPRKNRTLKALEELDKALKSRYLLQYIDELELRQNVYQALNRGEGYHSLKRAIFFDDQGKFKVNSEYEQLIWSESTRLIALCIIYYNTFLFSQMLSKSENGEREGLIFKQDSPVRWKHIDWYGKFHFQEQPDKQELDRVLTLIEKMDLSVLGTV